MKNIMKNTHSLQINGVKLYVHEAWEKSNTEMSMSCQNVKICHALLFLKRKQSSTNKYHGKLFSLQPVTTYWGLSSILQRRQQCFEKNKKEHLILSGLANSIFIHMLCFICSIAWYSSKKCNSMKSHLRRLATPSSPYIPYGVFWAAWDMLVFKYQNKTQIWSSVWPSLAFFFDCCLKVLLGTASWPN